MMPTFDRDELLDLIVEAIGDSMDVDWTCRDGARSVLRALEEDGILRVADPAPCDCDLLVRALQHIVDNADNAQVDAMMALIWWNTERLK